tara:strand:- start:559 stop:2847 length:2289 start_codon:yes stop_codon:yes gene_type:complete
MGAACDKKKTIATHMHFKSHPTYLSMRPYDETKLLHLMAKYTEQGIPMYMHECFRSCKFALVFDIDHEIDVGMKPKELKDILKPIYRAVRDFFETSVTDFNCIVYNASYEKKISYHVHWPDLIVNQQTAKELYDYIYKIDNDMHDYIDFQVAQNCSLRMPFSDKFDNNIKGPAFSRKLMFQAAYNCNGVSGKIYFPDWINDTFELLTRSVVRRPDSTPLTKLKRNHTNIVSLVGQTTEPLPIDIDMEEHEASDFMKMPPEYYSLIRMESVILYLQDKYVEDRDTFFDKIVTYMNNFVCMISDHPGKTIFLLRRSCPTGGDQQFTYVQKNQKDFLQVVEHIKVEQRLQTSDKAKKTITTSIGNVWMTHPKRKCFSSIVFSPEPGKCSGNDFNMFQGLRITSNISRDVVHASSVDYKEYIKPILTHLRTVWCDDDEHTYEYVVRWLAHATLKPWVKIGTALVLVGGEGCGKSMVVDAIGKVFGCHYLHIMDMEDMLGKFCSILEDKLFVFSDEAFWGGCKSLAGKLKGMITEPEVRVERKGFDCYYVNSYSNFIIASNNSHAVPAGEGARRWVCLGCSNRHQGDTNYFSKLKSTLCDNDYMGIKCLLHYFASDLDIENWIPQKVPVTNLLRAQKQNSYDSIELFWDAVLNRAYVVPWVEYQYIDPYYEDQSEIRKTYGEKFEYQLLTFQKLYQIYKEEMSGQFGKVFAAQRFKQYMRDKNFYTKVDAPEWADCKREVWLCINITNCRHEWKIHHCDPDMLFECS